MSAPWQRWSKLIRQMVAHKAYYHVQVAESDARRLELPFAPCRIHTDGMRAILFLSPESDETRVVQVRGVVDPRAAEEVAQGVWPSEAGRDSYKVDRREAGALRRFLRSRPHEPFSKAPAGRLPVCGASWNQGDVAFQVQGGSAGGKTRVTPPLDARLLEPCLRDLEATLSVARDPEKRRIGLVVLRYVDAALAIMPIIEGSASPFSRERR